MPEPCALLAAQLALAQLGRLRLVVAADGLLGRFGIRRGAILDACGHFFLAICSSARFEIFAAGHARLVELEAKQRDGPGLRDLK